MKRFRASALLLAVALLATMIVAVAGLTYPIFFELVFLIVFMYVLHSQGHERGMGKLRLLALPTIIFAFLAIVNFFMVYSVPLPPDTPLNIEIYSDMLYLRYVASLSSTIQLSFVIIMIVSLSVENYLRPHSV